MNARERFLKTLLFDQPDKVPLEPGNGRESTRARWHREGLPETVTDIAEYAYRCAGGNIPGCDHGVPSDVSWPNFVYYTKLLAQATGWM